jgi:hypothetical protein
MLTGWRGWSVECFGNAGRLEKILTADTGVFGGCDARGNELIGSLGWLSILKSGVKAR